MVIDTSAIVAAIAGEPDYRRYEDAIRNAELRLISAVTVLETEIVLFSRLGPTGVSRFRDLLAQAAITVVPFDQPLAEAPFDAFRQFGKRARPPRAAQHRRLRRLRARTDVPPALSPA
jgi:ribonuclease VapC